MSAYNFKSVALAGGGALSTDVNKKKTILASTKLLFGWGRLWDSVVKYPPTNVGDARDAGLIPGLGRSPGEGNGNPLPAKSHEQRNLVGYNPWSHKRATLVT